MEFNSAHLPAIGFWPGRGFESCLGPHIVRIMCELEVYTVRGDKLEKAMEGVIKLTLHDGKVFMQGIFGDSLEVNGKLSEVNIIAQKAFITLS